MTLARAAEAIVHDYTRSPDDFKKRIVNDVRAPERTRPPDEQFFLQMGNSIRPNIALLRRHFHSEGRLKESQAIWILERAKEIFAEEPNVLDLEAPITICGDIHGQYYDLMKLFDVGGSPSKGRYLFLGDYVDRGSFSIECVLYLFALKIWYPKLLFLLRGNHECRNLTDYFTFKVECKRKYSDHLYEVCMAAFDKLPLAAIVNKQFFCAHGGLSPEMTTVDDLRIIDRFREPPPSGLMCDVMWSDPAEEGGDPTVDFMHNSARGCSYYYTYALVCKFLKRNKLLSVIRAHEAQKEGYRMYKKTPDGFPSIITVFSCPNYLDTYGNKAAILIYDRKLTVRQFTAQPHPYWLPSFMDAFTWTLPFVAQKVASMFQGLLTTISSEEDEEAEAEEKDLTAEEIYARRQHLKEKIRDVGRMSRVFALLREESELVSELKRLDNGNGEDVDMDTIGVGLERIRSMIRGFDEARASDVGNERVPYHHEPEEDRHDHHDGDTGHYEGGGPVVPRHAMPMPTPHPAANPHPFASPSARHYSPEVMAALMRRVMQDEQDRS